MRGAGKDFLLFQNGFGPVGKLRRTYENTFCDIISAL